MITIGRCEYWDPATGHRCKHSGKRLRLLASIGNFIIHRTFCHHHSDWIETPEPKPSEIRGKRCTMVFIDELSEP